MEDTEKPGVLGKLYEALVKIEEEKPNDRSEADRRYAIVKTDLEKLIAYCEIYLCKKN